VQEIHILKIWESWGKKGYYQHLNNQRPNKYFASHLLNSEIFRQVYFHTYYEKLLQTSLDMLWEEIILLF